MDCPAKPSRKRPRLGERFKTVIDFSSRVHLDVGCLFAFFNESFYYNASKGVPVKVPFRSYESALVFVRLRGLPVLLESSFNLRWKKRVESTGDFEARFQEALQMSPMGEVYITPLTRVN